MEFEQLIRLIDYVSASKLTAFRYEDGNLKLSMKCGRVQEIAPAKGMDAECPSAYVRSGGKTADEEETETPDGNLVKSPLVGTFYAAPSEEADPFVKVGDRVKKGQILAIVEAMKLMNEIESDYDGEIAEIYAENGQAVEYGMPLFRIV